MVFSSFVFLFYFFPAFLLGYYVSGWRTGALLVGSVAFYVWGEGAYVVLLGGLIVINYAAARAISGAEGKARNQALAAVIALDLAVLVFFKYAGFLATNINALLPGDPLPVTHLALPLGISFFTFQLISYVADVAWGKAQVERDLTRFSAYILMFPHLIAGPIVRYADIREEMHADRKQTTRLGLGIQYVIVGLCQKVLVANTLAPVADHVFGAPIGSLSAATAWLGTLSYTLQIYFDFCGYSNMAIGLAFMLGFTYPRNFNYPYAAQSMTDFWRRWHISLSSWFRDYVYIPLGGNRAGRWATVRNLLIVFFLTGLWHGAAWSFIVWGLFHGAFLLLERFGLSRLLNAGPRLVRHGYVLVVMMLGWVFFRADTLPHALRLIGVLFSPALHRPPDYILAALINNEVIAALALGMILAVPTLPRMLDALRLPRVAGGTGAITNTLEVHALPALLLLTGLVLSLAHLATATLNPFLYFRF